MNQNLAGTAYLTVDGRQYMVAGRASWSPSVVERETMSGMSGVHGYAEKPIPGKITMQLRDSGGLSVAAFNRMRDATVMLELANGKMVIGRNMWTVGSQEVESSEATLEVRWEGPSVTEA